MLNFEFAFDNRVFSDRILNLEVIPSAQAPPSASSSTSSSSSSSQVALGGSNNGEENGDQKVVAAAAQKPVIEKVHVSSVILAAHSDYFMRLFSNGMIESNSESATVQVTEKEKVGIQELIRYMYTGRLREPIDAEATITLLCLADRFAISSCMEPLAKVLKRFPSTLNDCLLLLGLPESLKSDRAVQPVVEQCRTYLAQQFQDIAMKKGDFLSLSIEGVKVVLDSDALMVTKEEEVFQIVLDWLEVNCCTAEQKQEVAVEVVEVIRFPWMTGDFLVDVVSPNPHMQSEACQALVMEALKFKSYTHSRQQQMLWKKTKHNRYRPRNNTILENCSGNSKTFQEVVEYTVAMKRDYSQNYDTKTSGSFDLKVSEATGTCIVFSDFFSGCFIERGFNFPRWNLTINGPGFLHGDCLVDDYNKVLQPSQFIKEIPHHLLNFQVHRIAQPLLPDDAALAYAHNAIKSGQLPPQERALLQAERQEHSQEQGSERSMGCATATPKQIAYLHRLGCTVNPTSRLHASQLIDQYTERSTATPEQIAYLHRLGCTVNPTSRLHASELIDQYKKL